MATLVLDWDTDRKVAHFPEVRAHIEAKTWKAAMRAQVILDTESRVRTGKSQVYVNTGMGLTDGWITLVDNDADPAAVAISWQHTVLWRAITGG